MPLSSNDVAELLKARREDDRRKDLNKVNAERLRTETAGILRSRSLGNDEASIKAQYPYVEQCSPYLFTLAMQEDPPKVQVMLDLILGHIVKAREADLSGEQCSQNVDRDLTSLFVSRKTNH